MAFGSGPEGAVEVILGLDVGTTSAKAVALDQTGEIRASAASDPIATRCAPDGTSEQTPEEIWQALVTAGRRVVEGLPARVQVEALAVAAQSGSVIPILATGRAERAVTWMDTRFRAVVESWPPLVTDRIRALSGWTPAPGTGLSTIAGLLASSEPTLGPVGGPAPDPANLVTRWASVDDYLMFRLTKRWATNPSNASGMGLMEVSTRKWSEELGRIAGVNLSMLSEIGESGTAVGGLTSDAATTVALPAGTPVVMGGHDQACAALGLGAVDPGAMFLSAGTAWVLTVVTDRADVDALPPVLNLSPHVVAGRWTASQNLGGLGVMIAGSRPDRASFETCAHRVRQALEGAGELAAGGSELILVGGGSRFPELIDIIATAIDRPVRARSEVSSAALGAAMLAGSASGWPLRGESA